MRGIELQEKGAQTTQQPKGVSGNTLKENENLGADGHGFLNAAVTR
jgi:hypothetical protein